MSKTWRKNKCVSNYLLLRPNFVSGILLYFFFKSQPVEIVVDDRDDFYLYQTQKKYTNNISNSIDDLYEI